MEVQAPLFLSKMEPIPEEVTEKRQDMAEKKNSLFLYSLGNSRNFIRYYRKRIIVVLVLSAFIILSLAFADRPADWQDKPGFMNGITFSWLDDILSGGVAQEVADQVQIHYDESGAIQIGSYHVPGISNVVHAANDMCKGIAVLFIIITFFLSLLSMRSMDQMDEEFTRRMIMMVLGFGLAYFSMPMSFTVANVGSELAHKIADAGNLAAEPDALGAMGAVKGIIYDETHVEAYDHAAGGVDYVGPIDKIQTWGENAMTSFGYMIQLFIPWLAMKAVRAVVFMVVWGRAFEIMALATFSPLAFMEVPDVHHVGRGPGMRFIKNMLALSISGAVIVFITLMANAIDIAILNQIIAGAGNGFGTVMSGIMSMVVIGLAEVGMVTKSQQVARTVVGMG